jgi:fumarate reductase flavoprotein subunit
VIQAGIDAGYIFKADTVEELAGLIGIDPEVLVNTVDTYNDSCAAGVDAEFGKPAEFLNAVESGPFYAVEGCAFMYTTSGCLDVNTDFQVLLSDGVTPIGGLYAVGTDCMGVILSEQEQYIDYGGAAAAWCFTSGRLVGEALAALSNS